MASPCEETVINGAHSRSNAKGNPKNSVKETCAFVKMVDLACEEVA